MTTDRVIVSPDGTEVRRLSRTLGLILTTISVFDAAHQRMQHLAVLVYPWIYSSCLGNWEEHVA